MRSASAQPPGRVNWAAELDSAPPRDARFWRGVGLVRRAGRHPHSCSRGHGRRAHLRGCVCPGSGSVTRSSTPLRECCWFVNPTARLLGLTLLSSTRPLAGSVQTSRRGLGESQVSFLSRTTGPALVFPHGYFRGENRELMALDQARGVLERLRRSRSPVRERVRQCSRRLGLEVRPRRR